MSLFIRQRVFSWTDTYDVYDEAGNPVYYVRGEFLSLGHRIHVYRKDTGEEVGAVYQRLLTLLPRFDIELGGRIVGSVSKELSLFFPRYRVDFRNWSVEGDILHWNYSVLEAGAEVMRIEKQWLSWGDTYALDCRDLSRELAGLLVVLAIDAANCEE